MIDEANNGIKTAIANSRWVMHHTAMATISAIIKRSPPSPNRKNIPIMAAPMFEEFSPINNSYAATAANVNQKLNTRSLSRLLGALSRCQVTAGVPKIQSGSAQKKNAMPTARSKGVS